MDSDRLIEAAHRPEATATAISSRVRATPEALEVIERLAAEHGPLVFLQSGGCCDGSSPQCLRRGELLIGPNDLLLGEVGGAEFYVDKDLYERWNRPELVIGVSPDAGDTFSLEGLVGVHFVSLPPER